MHRLAKQGMALVVGAAVSLCPGLALSKESAINSAPSYIIRGDTISRTWRRIPALAASSSSVSRRGPSVTGVRPLAVTPTTTSRLPSLSR